KGTDSSDKDKLRRLAAELREHLATLKGCLEKCPKEEKKVDDKTDTGTGVTDGPKKGEEKKDDFKLPAIPKCTDADFEAKKKAFLDELEKLNKAIVDQLGSNEAGLRHDVYFTDPKDPKYKGLKKKLDDLQAHQKAINELRENAETQWKNDEDNGPQKNTD